VAANPGAALVSPVVHNVRPRAIEDDLWRAVWCSTKLDPTDRVALALGFFSGLRRRELVDLNSGHFDQGAARLVGFTRKGGYESSFPYGSALRLHAERLPALIPEGADAVLAMIHHYVRHRAGKPFLLAWGDDLGRDDDLRLRGRRRVDQYPLGWTPPNVVNNRLRSVLRRCGLPPDAFTPHALRHSFVSNLLRAGVPLHVVSRLASHSDIATTMRYVLTVDDPLAELLTTASVPRPSRWVTPPEEGNASPEVPGLSVPAL
jgi:integrase